ncbi:hypothetical protein ACCT30_48070, partial [Rhizobium ruizarguesonis]
SLAKVLRNIGFFEERQSKGETTYWVPFVYRSYLALSQGKMQELQNGNFVDLSQFEYLFEDLDDEEPQSA